MNDEFVKAIQHRLVDLGWKANRFCEEAGLSKGHWSEIARNKKSPSLETLRKALNAVGLKLEFNPIKKP